MTKQPKRRFMDWDDMPDEAPTSSERNLPFSQNVVIMPEPHSERWYALWAVSAVSTGGEFYGTR